MEPTTATNGSSGEMGPQPSRVELSAMPNGPDSKASQEVGEQRAETREIGPAGPSSGAPVPVSVSQLPAVSPAATTQTVVDPVVDDTPLAAADDELLEKEWVEKAKKIVAQTKDDPYNLEKEVSKLQADYIKKRYGKDIKLSSD